jgi:hypothetical protein
MDAQRYHLRLNKPFPPEIVGNSFMIEGEEWITVNDDPAELSGPAIVYPQHDVLVVRSCGEIVKTPHRFKTVEDFRRELLKLPIWDKTRWAILEVGCNFDYWYIVHDCATGEDVRDHETMNKLLFAIPGPSSPPPSLRKIGLEITRELPREEQPEL